MIYIKPILNCFFFFILFFLTIKTAKSVDAFGGVIEDLLLKYNKRIIGKRLVDKCLKYDAYLFRYLHSEEQ